MSPTDKYPRSWQPPNRRRSRRGMTLIEIMAVIVIIGVAAGGLGFGLGALTRVDIKSGCNTLLSAARFAYNRALIRGTTVRIAFDIPGKELSIEEAHGRVTLASADQQQSSAEKESAEDRGADVDPWKAAESRLQQQQTAKPALGASPFGALTDKEGKALTRYSKIALGRRVQIVKLITPHDPAPRESGKGAIYFFPGGLTEHAVAQLSDGSNTVYSVEIRPLTGRGIVHKEAYEPRELLGTSTGSREVSEVELP